MSKPEADPSSGISLGDVLRLPKQHPACRRREARLGSCTERENLACCPIRLKLRGPGNRPQHRTRRAPGAGIENYFSASRSRTPRPAIVSNGIAQPAND
jgi:hypothetical protein